MQNHSFWKTPVAVTLREAGKHNFTIPRSSCCRNIENIYTHTLNTLLLSISIHLDYFPAILNQTLINFPHENKKCMGNNKMQGSYCNDIAFELWQFTGLLVDGGRMWPHTVGKWVSNIGNPAEIFLIKSNITGKSRFFNNYMLYFSLTVIYVMYVL